MATTKQKRKVLNIVMVALAAVIVVAGIVFFMSVRGGGQGASSPFTVSSKIGNANIERAGISYALDEGTALQADDVVETLNGSEIGVKGAGDTELFLADASKMKVKASDSSGSKASLEPMSGCLFANARSADAPLALEGSGLSWKAGDAVFVSDVRAGSVTVQVLSGEVSFADGAVVKSGESRTVLTGQAQDSAASSSAEASSGAADAKASASTDTTGKLTLGSLDSFALEHALDVAKAGRELAFSSDQINGELERRENERLQIAEQAASPEGQGASGAAADVQGENAEAGGQGAAAEGGTTSGGESGDQPAATPSDNGQSDAKHTCTIQIRCDTILKNMDNLAKGKSKYVPKSGRILGSTTMSFTEGESAFDVLKRACKNNGIALEYSYAPVYGSYYVEGIGNLYEFDCGDESGWMFKVNGWFPNYGCSEYKLSDGDAIVFCYTCHGLGEDVGA